LPLSWTTPCTTPCTGWHFVACVMPVVFCVPGTVVTPVVPPAGWPAGVLTEGVPTGKGRGIFSRVPFEGRVTGGEDAGCVGLVTAPGITAAAGFCTAGAVCAGFFSGRGLSSGFCWVCRG